MFVLQNQCSFMSSSRGRNELRALPPPEDDEHLTSCSCRNRPSSSVTALDLSASCFCSLIIDTLLLTCDLRRRRRTQVCVVVNPSVCQQLFTNTVNRTSQWSFAPVGPAGVSPRTPPPSSSAPPSAAPRLLPDPPCGDAGTR